MTRENSYTNVLKSEMAISASHKRTIFITIFLAILVLLLVILLATAAVLYFQKEKDLQELEGVINKIRTILHLHNDSRTPGKESDSFMLSDVQLLENINKDLSTMQERLENVTASQAAAHHRYRELLGFVSSGWKFYNGSFYLFSPMGKPWQEAEKNCVSYGAHLTSVTSWEEMEYLSREASRASFWIGLTDQWEEGNWTWVDGTKYDSKVSFWEARQPDNWPGAPDHQEDCVITEKRWVDVSCTYSYKWFCKKTFS